MTVEAPKPRVIKTRIFVGRSVEEINKIHAVVGGPAPVAYDTYREDNGFTGEPREWVPRLLKHWGTERPLATLYYIQPHLERVNSERPPYRSIMKLPGTPEQFSFLTDEVWVVNPDANCVHNWRSKGPTHPANSLDI